MLMWLVGGIVGWRGDRVMRLLKKPTRLEVAEKTDAGRVAPISACVSSSTKRRHQTLPLMGATRLASGKYAAIISSRSVRI